MTINKAIEILDDKLNQFQADAPLDEYDAIRLGIEALKAVKRFRCNERSANVGELPGETKD